MQRERERQMKLQTCGYDTGSSSRGWLQAPPPLALGPCDELRPQPGPRISHASTVISPSFTARCGTKSHLETPVTAMKQMYDTPSKTMALCFHFSEAVSAATDAGSKGWQEPVARSITRQPSPFEGKTVPRRHLKTTHLQIEGLLVAQGTDVREVERGRAAEVAQLVRRQAAGRQVGHAAAPLVLLPHVRAAEALLAVVGAAEGGGGGRAELCVRCRLFGVVELVSYFILLLTC